jgi:hypothetical protein
MLCKKTLGFVHFSKNNFQAPHLQLKLPAKKLFEKISKTEMAANTRLEALTDMVNKVMSDERLLHTYSFL